MTEQYGPGPVNVYFFLDRQRTTRATRRYAHNPRVLILFTNSTETVRTVRIFHRQDGDLAMTLLNPRDTRLERDMTTFQGRVESVSVYSGGFLDVTYHDDLQNVIIAGIQRVSRVYMSLYWN
jgi:hypothetical protein